MSDPSTSNNSSAKRKSKLIVIPPEQLFKLGIANEIKEIILKGATQQNAQKTAEKPPEQAKIHQENQPNKVAQKEVVQSVKITPKEVVQKALFNTITKPKPTIKIVSNEAINLPTEDIVALTENRILSPPTEALLKRPFVKSDKRTTSGTETSVTNDSLKTNDLQAFMKQPIGGRQNLKTENRVLSLPTETLLKQPFVKSDTNDSLKTNASPTIMKQPIANRQSLKTCTRKQQPLCGSQTVSSTTNLSKHSKTIDLTNNSICETLKKQSQIVDENLTSDSLSSSTKIIKRHDETVKLSTESSVDLTHDSVCMTLKKQPSSDLQTVSESLTSDSLSSSTNIIKRHDETVKLPTESCIELTHDSVCTTLKKHSSSDPKTVSESLTSDRLSFSTNIIKRHDETVKLPTESCVDFEKTNQASSVPQNVSGENKRLESPKMIIRNETLQLPIKNVVANVNYKGGANCKKFSHAKRLTIVKNAPEVAKQIETQSNESINKPNKAINTVAPQNVSEKCKDKKLIKLNIISNESVNLSPEKITDLIQTNSFTSKSQITNIKALDLPIRIISAKEPEKKLVNNTRPFPLDPPNQFSIDKKNVPELIGTPSKQSRVTENVQDELKSETLLKRFSESVPDKPENEESQSVNSSTQSVDPQTVISECLNEGRTSVGKCGPSGRKLKSVGQALGGLGSDGLNKSGGVEGTSRRGRKRLNVNYFELLNSEGNGAESRSLDASGTPLKRKRGRPKKTPNPTIIEDLPVEETKIAVETPVVKRKVGRPRKIVAPLETSQVCDVSNGGETKLATSVSNVETNEGVCESAKTETIEPDSKTIEKKSETPQLKRKRGRLRATYAPEIFEKSAETTESDNKKTIETFDNKSKPDSDETNNFKAEKIECGTSSSSDVKTNETIECDVGRAQSDAETNELIECEVGSDQSDEKTSEFDSTIEESVGKNEEISDDEMVGGAKKSSRRGSLVEEAEVSVKEKRKRKKKSDSNVCVCAVCKSELPKASWHYHKLYKHNNLAWKEGDQPLDLENKELVKKTLQNVISTGKRLTCDRCNKKIKSVVGFSCHQFKCQRSKEEIEKDEVACEECGRKMMPVLLSQHLRTVHNKHKRVRPEPQLPTAPLETRRAAKRALDIIKEEDVGEGIEHLQKFYTSWTNFKNKQYAHKILESKLLSNKILNCPYEGCSIKHTDVEKMKEHMSDCEKKPPHIYCCKICLLMVVHQKDIVEHLKIIHGVDEALDKTYTNKRLKDVQKKSNESYYERRMMPSFLDCNQESSFLYSNSFIWTYRYFFENMSCNLLFEKYDCQDENYSLIPENLLEEYLPSLSESCDVAFLNLREYVEPIDLDFETKRLELFEAQNEENGNSVIFCGGPVTGLSWLPTRFDKHDSKQILAISVLDNADKTYSTEGNDTPTKCLIQFWNLGPITNAQVSNFPPENSFSFGIDYGPVLHLEWCPSGCFTKQSDEPETLGGRLGLLAVAGYDSCVFIYSVPDYDTGLVYNPKPWLKLSLGSDPDDLKTKYFPTRISWTKAAGHNYIAVGYNTGMVAVFNLKATSPLLWRKDKENIDVLLPYISFFAHSHSITGVHLHPMNECRWLFTTSFEKEERVWDLQNTTTPISVFKTNVLTDSAVFLHWTCQILTSDDSSSQSNSIGTCYKQLRDFLSERKNFLFSLSTISSISASDWLNCIIQGSVTGEIAGIFFGQMFRNFHNNRNLREKTLRFGYTALIEKGKTKEELRVLEKAKSDALENSLFTRRNIKDEDLQPGQNVNHLDYNPHYYQYEPINYREATEKYSLVFCDYKMSSQEDLKSLNSKQKSVCKLSRPNLYQIESVTKIAISPNNQSSLYFATGYRAGFVRIRFIKALHDDLVKIST